MNNREEHVANIAELASLLVIELKAGIEVIRKISDESFGAAQGRNGSIGAHFRHIIEIADALFEGLQARSVNYSARERNRLIEADRANAVRELNNLISRAESMGHLQPSVRLDVISENIPSVKTASSLGRELEFTISHTVHHYALISERLSSAGYVMADGFGVASSTKRYWRSLDGKTSNEQ